MRTRYPNWRSKLSLAAAVGAAFLAVLADPARAGTSTHGGDTTIDRDNVWFLGERPIEYCVEVAPNFPEGLARGRAAVREGLDRWIAFFRKYGLDRARFSYLRGGAALGLALDFREVPRCDRPREQIRFLLGVSSPEVAHALESAEFPFGFAIRGDYDHATYRNGGVVWARNWSYRGDGLLHVLMHELGHVFGFEHDTLPLMSSNFGEQILVHPLEYSPVYGMIETPTWTYAFRPGDTIDFSYGGRGTAGPGGPRCEPNHLIWPFRELFGFDAQQCHRLEVHFDGPGPGHGPTASVRLTVRITQLAPGTPPKELSLSGPFVFRPVARPGVGEARGPVLHTLRFCPECGPNGSFKPDRLDHSPAAFPLEGQLAWGSQLFPAILDRAGGYYLRIFVPSRNVWWGVENYWSTPYLRH